VSDSVREGLERYRDPKLVAELLQAHADAKYNFYVGGLRLSAVEAGRFCEAAFRILEETVDGKYTPLNRKLDTEKLITRLANIPAASHHESVRLHIPRALRVVYDIRNNRDAAHLADGIDPNKQDATLVASVIDWVLAEFVRLFHGVPPDEAQGLVEDLVTRRAPVVQMFGEYVKVLNPNLPAGDHCLVTLYQMGAEGASYDDLREWARPEMVTNLARTLQRLVYGQSYVHQDGERYFITEAGVRYVDETHLLDPT
jgi:hypothetical protein